jgi:hypothetical protein
MGKLEIDEVQPAAFSQIFDLPFLYKRNVTQKIRCDTGSFGIADPFPETAKQCFCDSVGRKDLDEVEAQFQFFQGMMAIETLQASAAAAAERNAETQQKAAAAAARLNDLKENAEAEIARQ